MYLYLTPSQRNIISHSCSDSFAARQDLPKASSELGSWWVWALRPPHLPSDGWDAVREAGAPTPSRMVSVIQALGNQSLFYI